MTPWRMTVKKIGLTGPALRSVGYTAYVAVVAIAMSYGIGFGTSAGLLIPLALPLGIAFVAAMFWLPDRVQLVGWAVLTVWLLSTTYLGFGDQEYFALVAIVVLSLLGVFKSPWFLVAAWALHPLWDVLVPRHLHDSLTDLPIGCLIYDLVIALYLGWRASRGRLAPVGGTPKVGWPTALRNSGMAVYVGLVLLAQVLLVTAASDASVLLWAAVPTGVMVVLAMVWLPGRAQLLGWVVITGWMAMTYAHSGELLEIVVFVVLLTLAVLGFTASPWYLVAAWAAHVVWDFAPRVMEHTGGMGHLGHAPLAAALYEIVVLGYLVYAVRRGVFR